MTAKQKLCMGLIPLLLLLPIPTFADDDDGEESIENLGWVAIGAGIIANLPFIVINKYRKYAVSAGGQSLVVARKIGSSFKAILIFHISSLIFLVVRDSVTGVWNAARTDPAPRRAGSWCSRRRWRK